MIVDYHVHTKLSHDGKNTMEEMCQAAIKIGVKEIAFTEHYDPKDSLFADNHYQCNVYSEAIQKVKSDYEGQLAVKAAIELGDVLLHRLSAAHLIQKQAFDYVLLSVHFLANEDMSLLDFHDINRKECMEQYYTNLMDSVTLFHDYDCLAYLDLPKRYFRLANIPVNYSDYREMAREVLKKAIENNKGIEINSSTMQNCDEPMPSITLIKDFIELGGNIVTLGSDSHCTDTIGKGIKECKALLKECGLAYFTTFENRKPIFHKIS